MSLKDWYRYVTKWFCLVKWGFGVQQGRQVRAGNIKNAGEFGAHDKVRNEPSHLVTHPLHSTKKSPAQAPLIFKALNVYMVIQWKPMHPLHLHVTLPVVAREFTTLCMLIHMLLGGPNVAPLKAPNMYSLLTSFFTCCLKDGCYDVVLPFSSVPMSVSSLHLSGQLTHTVVDLGLQNSTFLPEISHTWNEWVDYSEDSLWGRDLAICRKKNGMHSVEIPWRKKHVSEETTPPLIVII